MFPSSISFLKILFSILLCLFVLLPCDESSAIADGIKTRSISSISSNDETSDGLIFNKLRAISVDQRLQRRSIVRNEAVAMIQRGRNPINDDLLAARQRNPAILSTTTLSPIRDARARWMPWTLSGIFLITGFICAFVISRETPLKDQIAEEIADADANENSAELDPARMKVHLHRSRRRKGGIGSPDHSGSEDETMAPSVTEIAVDELAMPKMSSSKQLQQQDIGESDSKFKDTSAVSLGIMASLELKSKMDPASIRSPPAVQQRQRQPKFGSPVTKSTTRSPPPFRAKSKLKSANVCKIASTTSPRSTVKYAKSCPLASNASRPSSLLVQSPPPKTKKVTVVNSPKSAVHPKHMDEAQLALLMEDLLRKQQAQNPSTTAPR